MRPMKPIPQQRRKQPETKPRSTLNQAANWSKKQDHLFAADLRVARNGKIRDSFSFRHFYITQQIREGVGHHLLGRNVGTSSKMIDAYYSKIRPTDEIAQLIPDWSKKRLLQYRRK